MVHAMEFHGRLRRADGRPAEAGVYDLLFTLLKGPDTGSALWEELVRDVAVAEDGGYHAVLGVRNALRASLFDGSTRYLSVRGAPAGRLGPDVSDRVPVLALPVRVGDDAPPLDERIAAIASSAEETALVRHRMRVLRRRIRRIEAGQGPLAAMLARIGTLEAQLARLEGADGRVARLEDELEDIVGPDGDLIDLTERIEALEKGGRSGRGPG